MWRDPAVGCDPALPVPDQRRGDCDQHKDAHYPAGPGRLSVAHQRDHHEQLERQAGEHERHAAATGETPGQVARRRPLATRTGTGREHRDVASVVRDVVPH
jgi:hypothetical protein